MWSAGMDSFIIAALAVCSLTAPAYGDKGTSKARSCSDIKVFYKGKGFLVEDVPQFEISGKLLFVLCALHLILTPKTVNDTQKHVNYTRKSHTAVLNSIIISLQNPSKNGRLIVTKSPLGCVYPSCV